MNSRPDDHEMSTSSSSRVSARSRFSPAPSASLLSPQPGLPRTPSSSSASRSKGGINGRGGSYDDEESSQGGLSSRSSVRSADKKRSANAASREQGDVERDFRLARSRSSSSAASGTSSTKDRPWRTSSSASGNNDKSSSRGTSREELDTSDKESSPYRTNTSPSSRWSQYETENLAEESRKATSAAANRAASRLADGMGEEVPYSPASPMGGAVGSGYEGGGGDETQALQSNGNSLPGPGTSRSSTTDYVKSRLSSLLSTRNEPEQTIEYGVGAPSQHDRVRNEALKMLQIADSCLAESPGTSPRSPRAASAGAGLFRTAGGGMAMRELHPDESERMSLRRDKDVAAVAGLDRFSKSEGDIPAPPRFDGHFAIGSPARGDGKSPPRMPKGAGDGDDTPSLWSSRYSVERQLMAITGGLDSEHMLAKMDNLHASRSKTKSARGLYRASAGAMDGSHEEYGDYTQGSSIGLGLGGAWNWMKDTFWTTGIELNNDGTTQSLVRREKARVRRRRIRVVGLFSVGLFITIAVLAAKGRSGAHAAKYRTPEMNFYVVADEPYSFENFDQFTRELEALPRNAEFVVHLGNANGDRESMCKEYGFERAANILKESPVPVLVVPGDLDWAACGNKRRSQEALRYWDVNLGKLENSWPHPLDVEYYPDVVGNFAFLHKSTLFISINLIEQETNAEEWTDRLEKNVEWTRSKIRQFGDDYSNVVILGHAPPSSKQGEYFWPVVEEVKALNRPVLYLHANSSGSFEVYRPFGEAENLTAVQLERRGVEGPMKVTIKRDGNDPFKFERRQPAKERT